MKYTIFAYFDLELEKFFPPMLAPQSVDETFEGIRDAAIKGQIEDCANKDAYFLGTFETKDGSFDLESKPVKKFSLKQYAKNVKA